MIALARSLQRLKSICVLIKLWRKKASVFDFGKHFKDKSYLCKQGTDVLITQQFFQRLDKAENV